MRDAAFVEPKAGSRASAQAARVPEPLRTLTKTRSLGRSSRLAAGFSFGRDASTDGHTDRREDA